MSLNKLLIISLLLIGVIFRLILTNQGNFLFNIDNARDMVDVREMVELHKWRLIGPTSGIEGVYDGPAWYYLMTVPYLLSHGDPYSMIILEITIWAIGGFFLLKIISRWGWLPILVVGLIWDFSDLTVLFSRNALSPNQILFLMPVFLYLVEKSLTKTARKLNLYMLSTAALAGFFFNMEMAFGFILPIILVMTYLFYNRHFYRQLSFWLSGLVYLAFLLPQIFFDFRHQWVMSKALIYYLNHPNSNNHLTPIGHVMFLFSQWQSTLLGLLMNSASLLRLSTLIIILVALGLFKQKLLLKERTLIVSLIVLIIPFCVYLVVPISVMSWHVMAVASTWLILTGFSLGYLTKWPAGRLVGGIVLLLTVSTLTSTTMDQLAALNQLPGDTSLYKNETAAIDYVYQSAAGQNFRAYVYLPSVIDYPYQYLFWWYGLKKYGYTPSDYAYLPDKPNYISSKAAFNHPSSNGQTSLIYLIEEPDRIQMRQAWLNSFAAFPVIETTKVGSIDIEVRQDLSQMSASATL